MLCSRRRGGGGRGEKARGGGRSCDIFTRVPCLPRLDNSHPCGKRDAFPSKVTSSTALYKVTAQVIRKLAQEP